MQKRPVLAYLKNKPKMKNIYYLNRSHVVHRYAVTEIQTLVQNPAYMIGQDFEFKFYLPKCAIISKVSLSRLVKSVQYNLFFHIQWLRK